MLRRMARNRRPRQTNIYLDEVQQDVLEALTRKAGAKNRSHLVRNMLHRPIKEAQPLLKSTVTPAQCREKLGLDYQDRRSRARELSQALLTSLLESDVATLKQFRRDADSKIKLLEQA